MTVAPGRQTQDQTEQNLGLPTRRARIRAREARYMDLLDFLYEEASLLDAGSLDDWLKLLAEDVTYFMPVRTTRVRKDGPGFEAEYGHFDDDFNSLSFRVKKLATPSSWGEDPPSRVRRFVTNVQVFATDQDNESYATSDLLVVRNRFTNTTLDLLTAERRDVIRRIGEDEYRLAARRILIDQSTLATPNLAIFL